MNPQALHVSLVSEPNEFLALEPVWNSILCESGMDNVFLSWEWSRSWVGHFLGRDRIWTPVVTNDLDGQVLAIAPLVLRRRRVLGVIPLRELSQLGGGIAAADHLDFLIRPGHERAAVEAVFRFLQARRTEWDSLRLDALRSGSACVAHIAGRYPRWRYHLHRSPCPFIRLPASWDAFMASMDSKMRQNLRRYRRRLQRDFPDTVCFKEIRKSGEIEDAMETLFRLHRTARRRKRTGTAFDRAEVRCFHRELAGVSLRRGWLRLYLLRVNGKDVAARYGLSYRGRLSSFNTGYDPEWSHYAPGVLLLAHDLQRAVEERHRVYDFLRGNEAYKYLYTSEYDSDVWIRLASGGWGTLATRAYDLARRARRGLGAIGALARRKRNPPGS